MLRVSTNPIALLGLLLLLGTAAYAQNQPWPLKGRIDLSSGFGDFRANRFHAGVDLRTGGVTGAKVYSPVDGYVWRVKMSYRGYGKGLYIKGDDDHFYVLAHLSKFNETIQRVVLDHQFGRERYYADIYFPRDSIRVKKGQLVAYTGETGIGAPHLHFEKRTPDNVPIDPLSHGFELEDHVPPTFERIGFQLLDDRSLFRDGARRMFLPVTMIGPGRYRLDSVIYLSSPFGVLVHCYDQKRAGGMRQAVKSLTLLIDSVPYFDSELDSLPYEIGPLVSLTYDILEASRDEKRVRRLFRAVSSEELIRDATSVYGGESPGQCAYGLDSPGRPGRHHVQLTAEDMSGNRTTLTADFVWFDNDTLPGFRPPGSWMGDEGDEYEIVDFDVTEYGMIVAINRPQQIERLFFPPHVPNSSDADLRDLLLTYCQGRLLARGSCVDVVGWSGNNELVCDGQVFRAMLPEGKSYGARLMGVSTVDPPSTIGYALASRVYELLPEAFPIRKEFEVSIKLDPGVPANKHTGLCWFDKKENEWIWIDEEIEDDNLAAGSSLGGGLFAAIIDTTAPTITKLNLKSGHKYWNRQPRVKCRIEDNLSGFENDLSIDARVDGEYILPELDLESGEFVGLMRRPLSLGKHELTLSVTDRAGNRTERKVTFDVIRKQ